MDVRLTRLHLKNFKGLKDFELTPGGESIAVLGDNATGKTTIADAWSWLLFNKDSSGASQFEIKTLDGAGEPLHFLDHSVEAGLLINSRERSIKKLYREVYTKRRGESKKTFTGHTTDYELDGVPVSMGEYNEFIASIGAESILRTLTDPQFFSESLPWQERRLLLLEVCGNVTDREVMDADQKLFKPLDAALDGRSIEDHRRVQTRRRAEINKELDAIPVRIDEVRQNTPEVEPQEDDAAIATRIKLAGIKIRELLETRASIRSGGGIAQKKSELATVEAEITRARSRAEEKRSDVVRGLREDFKDKQAIAHRAGDTVLTTKLKKDDLQHQLDAVLDAKKKSEAGWKKAKAETFEFDLDDKCPTCGQPLPDSEIESARAKAEARFNEDKAAELVQIENEINRLDERSKGIILMIEDQKKLLDSLIIEAEAAETGSLEAKEKLDQAEAEAEKIEPLIAEELLARKTRLEAEIASLESGNTDALAAIDAERKEIGDRLDALLARQTLLGQARAAAARISDLGDKQRALGEEFERVEEQLILIEKLVRRRVSMLEEKINSKFKLARFKLFRELVNGGLDECCETVFEGVPFASLNHGARVQIGLDIIATLQKHYETILPIVIDQRESITEIPPMDCQVISLKVQAGCEMLTVVAVGQSTLIVG